MACKDELYDPVANCDSGSGDEDFEPNNNNAKMSSSSPSCGNNRINDVFIYNNLRTGGPMMNQPSKQSEVEGDGSDQKEGGATEMPQAKEQVEVEECWDPDETDEEKERARKMGPKTCENITPEGDLRCPHPNRNFVGFFYNHDAYCCSESGRKFCFCCATKTECPEHPTRTQKLPKRKPQKMD